MKQKIILSILIVSFGFLSLSPEVANADNSGFRPGNIISDEVFYNKNSMSVREIQTFLDNQTPECDTWGNGTVYGMKRKDYAANHGWGAGPYVCLQNYHENPNTGETSFEKGGGAFRGGLSSAQIIWDAAQKYGINPQVLLVILKKEQGSLFSDDWPFKSQYKYSMGYACPDSGPNYSANCVSTYGGFYNQINMSAWQLKRYKDHINEYQYRPGRTNYIQYSTQPNCGGKNVYIENVATASLYIYTPYTPNEGSLKNYPGEAQCGSYGNRNFYFFFKEWFGQPKISSSFVRTESNPSVYLISDDMKYPVSSMSFVDAASNLGNVQFVSQNYLDGKTTGPYLNRIIRGKDSSIYFYDKNTKLYFGSCQLISDYGQDCGKAIRLNDKQLSKFSNGPSVTNTYKNQNGEIYGVKSGFRHQGADLGSLTSSGFSSRITNLSNDGTNYLKLSNPIIREGVLVKNSGNSDYYYANTENDLIKIDNYIFLNNLKSKIPTFNLSDESVKLSKVKGRITDKVKTKNFNYAISDGNLYKVNAQDLVGNYTQVSDLFLNKFKNIKDLGSNIFIKAENSPHIYSVKNGTKRYIVSMQDLFTIAEDNNPTILSVQDYYIKSLKYRGMAIPPSSMVKFPDSATVYVTDGYDKLIPLGSFYYTNSLGIDNGVREINKSRLSNYSIDKDRYFLNLLEFNGGQYLGVDGKIYKLDTQSNSKSLKIDQETAKMLKLEKSQKLPEFLRLASTGAIYHRNGNKLEYIHSMQKYKELGGRSDNMLNIDKYTYSLFK